MDGTLITDGPTEMAKVRRPIPFLLGVTKNETGYAYSYLENGTVLENVFVECAVAAKKYGFELPNMVANECADFYTRNGECATSIM